MMRSSNINNIINRRLSRAPIHYQRRIINSLSILQSVRRILPGLWSVLLSFLVFVVFFRPSVWSVVLFFILLYVRPFVCTSFFLFCLCSSFILFVLLSFHPPIVCLFCVCPSFVCLVRPSVRPSVCLSVCLQSSRD